MNQPVERKASVDRKSWIGRLPQGWEVKRADAVLQYTKETVRQEWFEDIEVFYYSIPAIQEFGDGIVQNGSAINSDKILLKGGELLVSKLNPHKGTVLLTEPKDLPILCSTEFVPLIARPEIIRKYAFYVYSSQPVQEVISSQVKSATRSHQRANPEDISKIWLPLPPLPEQRAIADYLDRETTTLDALVDAKERLLDRLAEKRRAVITHAVTRGLDPDAPMRDSGLPWLGEIPAHWQLIKIGYFAEVGNGSTPKRDHLDYWEGGYFPWLNSSVVNDPVVGEPKDHVTRVALQECHLPIVKPGSVLVAITGQGKTRGMASLLDYEATINQHMAFFTPYFRTVSPEYLQLSLTGFYEVLRSISESSGSTKGALTIRPYTE